MAEYEKERYGKILIPLLTSFCEDGRVDFERTAALAEFIIDQKKGDSLVLAGSTGEFYAMSFDERVRLFETVKNKVGDRIPIIAGIGAASTIETIQLAKIAEKIGFETVMIVSPYYTKPNQEELYCHFMKVATSVSLNILLYNIPIYTGVNIDPSTISRLAEQPNIVGIKEEAELNPKQITAFLNCTPENFVIYNGDDTMILEAYAQGGEKRIGGVVSGSSHIIGHLIRSMIENFLTGKVQAAAEMQQRIYPFLKSMGQNNRINAAPLLKEALRLYGFDAGYPRAPLKYGNPNEIENIQLAMMQLDLLGK